MALQRTRVDRKTGAKILQKAARAEDGTYHVLVRVEKLADVEAMFKKGTAIKMRMRGADGQWNLVSPD